MTYIHSLPSLGVCLLLFPLYPLFLLPRPAGSATANQIRSQWVGERISFSVIQEFGTVFLMSIPGANHSVSWGM